MRQQRAQDQQRNDLTREFFDTQIRQADEEERTVELSFSSETPYERWFGPEVLDHAEGCVDLKRLKEIGCVLFNHDRDVVLGQIVKAWVENGRGKARIRFDDDEQAEAIFRKVKSGTLKGVSVGYSVDNWETVAPGKKSVDGRFKGPCRVAKRWMPYEISIVSIPADDTVGVGRQKEETQEQKGRSLDWFIRQNQINKNIFCKGGAGNE